MSGYVWRGPYGGRLLPTRGERPAYGIGFALTVVGLALLVVGSVDRSEYARSIYVNAGTALALFAVLVVLEPYLLRRLRVPQTLREAQDILAGSMQPHSAEHSQASLKESIEVSVRWVGDQLTRAGLRQVPSVQQNRALFRSERGAYGLVEWEIYWGESLGHVVSVTSEAGGVLRHAWQIELNCVERRPTAPAILALRGFEEQVFPIMVAIARLVTGAGAGGARPV